jgi:hypothetical protein
MGAARPGGARKPESPPTVVADALRRDLAAFCKDEARLKDFYAAELAGMQPARKNTDDPPELAI